MKRNHVIASVLAFVLLTAVCVSASAASALSTDTAWVPIVFAIRSATAFVLPVREKYLTAAFMRLSNSI